MILHGIFLVAILRSDGAMTAQDSKISSTIPSAYGLFGYHQAYISKHNASVLTAQLQARAGSTAVARPLPVSTEVATTVAGAKDASVAVAPVQAQAEGAQVRMCGGDHLLESRTRMLHPS